MIELSCADNTFRLVQPWESAVEMIRLLELDGVDVCLMGNRSHLRPEDVRDDLPGTAARITKTLQAHGLAASDLFCIPWTDFARTGGRPVPGEAWRMNLCRFDYHKDWKDPELSCVAPIAKKKIPSSQTRSPTRVLWNTVPAVTDAWYRQRRHCSSRRVRMNELSRPWQRGHRNP